MALVASPALAAKSTVQGTIKNLQATNFSPAKKKHQQYDFSIQTANGNYQCRTSQDHSTNATDFAVGSAITFVLDGKKGQVKTSNGKSAKCTITRVESDSQ